jgi:hypothetical protein
MIMTGTSNCGEESACPSWLMVGYILWSVPCNNKIKIKTEPGTVNGELAVERAEE